MPSADDRESSPEENPRPKAVVPAVGSTGVGLYSGTVRSDLSSSSVELEGVNELNPSKLSESVSSSKVAI